MRSKRVIYNILSNLLLQLIVLVYGFVVPKLIISHFGSDINGLVSSITQFLAYISLLEAGIGPVVKAALYKPIASNEKKQIKNILKSTEKFFRTIALMFIVYLLILIFIYPFIVQKQFDYLFTMSLIVIISISTFAEYFFGMTYKLYLQAEQKMYITSIVQIITYCLCIVFTILLVSLSSSIHFIKLISGLIFVLRPLLQNYYVKKKYKINLKDADKKYNLEQKWEGLAQHIAAVIHGNADITILTLFSTLTEVSVYSVYYMIIKGVKSVIQIFSSSIDASFGDMLARNEYDNLNKKFNLYETMFFTIITIVYICTIVLIIPFVKVYTSDINDVNYIRPLFGILLVLSEFMWSIRLPFSSLTLAAGHFRETRNGAWIEAISNLVISVVLVIKYGLVGVAIGTFVAMLIRTIEFVYHTNKHILKRNISVSFKKVIVIFIETVCISALIMNLIKFNVNSYLSWIIYAMITFGISSFLILLFNTLVYRKEFKELINILKNNISRKRKKA